MGAVPACRFLQGKDTDKEAVDNIRQAIRSGNETTVRILNYKKSGKPFWNMFTLAPMADVDGTPRFLIGVQVRKWSRAMHVCRLAGLCSCWVARPPDRSPRMECCWVLLTLCLGELPGTFADGGLHICTVQFVGPLPILRPSSKTA